MLATRHAVGTVGGVTEWARIAMLTSGRDPHQLRLRWARMAEMVAVVASALPPP
jgi:hypothetical protein